MINPDEVFKIGQFAKPHGIKGEITLIMDYDVSDDWDEQEEPYIICEVNGILVPFFVEEYRYKNDTALLLKLEGIDSEAEAREFSNRMVYYPLSKVNTNKLVGDITWDNFIGFTVVDKQRGEIGQITHVDETTLNVLLEIRYDGRDILLPAADELIQDVDYSQKRIMVSMPEGLFDL